MIQKYFTLPALVLLFMFSIFTAVASAGMAKPELRLYRLDCGHIHVDPRNVLSDINEFTGQDVDLVGSCYLLKHDAEWLLWDTGLPTAIQESPDGVQNGPFHLSIHNSVVSQLGKLGLTPADINYVALSHGHFDHTGSTNLFQNAELIIQKIEYEFFGNAAQARAIHMEPDLIDFFLTGKGKEQVRKVEGDVDIFGDGTVTTVFLPGHTPGHMGLKVKLPETGTVFLAGDQWYLEDDLERKGVADFNYDRANTLASSERLKQLIVNENGLLVIQHEPRHTSLFPALPSYLK